MKTLLFQLGALSRRLWVHAGLFAVLAVVAALGAVRLAPWVPQDWIGLLGESAVEDVLRTLASAMLPVVTFSMATVVTAHGALMTTVGPRAASLMIEDRGAHNALSSFVGAFIFSVVGLVALGTDYYGPSARLVLFFVTLLVLAWVIFRLLGWIDELSRMVRVRETIRRVETETRKALQKRHPFLDGVPSETAPPEASPLYSLRVGYVQHVDVSRLDRLAREHDVRVRLAVLPGGFVPKRSPLLHVWPDAEALSEDARHALVATVVVADHRDYRQDPRNGLVVLGEIASRALSPGVNDPGTAVDVISTAARVLSVWAERHWEAEPTRRHDRVFAPGLSAQDCFDDVFRPVARDGAAFVEVGVALQRALEDLSHSDRSEFRQAAVRTARSALARAEAALGADDDLALLRLNAGWALAQPDVTNA